MNKSLRGYIKLMPITKKLIVSKVLILTFLFLFSMSMGVAFAWDRTYSNFWSDQPGDPGKDTGHAPYEGDIYSNIDLGSTDIIKIQVEHAKYDQASLDVIENEYRNNNLRTGLDVTDVTDRLAYLGPSASNYPDPKFDVDDDDFDGKQEESEVTCQRVLDIVAGQTYYFHSPFYNYYNPAGSSGNLEVNSHMSWYDVITGEYQTEYHDFLNTIYYSTWE